MKYLIGIDGGASKTECTVTDLSGNVLHRSLGKPSNFLAIGLNAAVENLFDLIEGSLFSLKADFSNIELIMIGTAGAGRVEDAELLKSALIEFAAGEGIILDKITVVSDARIALEGAFSGKPGCIIISGTGSILYWKDEKNNIHRIGGFGRLIGDEGSGYSIGRKGLMTTAKELDGRREKTLITQLLKKEFTTLTSEALINSVYKEDFDIASVARIVIKAAESGDETANHILNNEADGLLLHIEAIKNKTSLKRIRIALIGSLIDNENFYSNLLKKKIKENYKYVELYKPENPPVIGAILLAKNVLNDTR